MFPVHTRPPPIETPCEQFSAGVGGAGYARSKLRPFFAAGEERAIGDLFVGAEVGDGVHFHIVADGCALETDAVEEPAIEDAAQRCRTARRIDLRIRSVTDHDAACFVAEAREGDEIAAI